MRAGLESNRETAALTLVEVLVLISVLGVLFALFMPGATHCSAKAPRIKCVSYFVGLDASQTNPLSLLAGDRNITNGSPGKDRVRFLKTDQRVGWTKEIHQHAGNVLLGDGSVQQLSSSRLRETLRDSGVVTNRLAIP